MDSKDDLNKFKLLELQQELESRGLETSGKKADLIDRLWNSLQMEKIKPKEKLEPETNVDESQVLLAKLRIIKEREALAEREVDLKAHLEKEQLRIKARSEQLDIELKLVESHNVSADSSDLEQLRVRSDVPNTDRSPDVSEVLAAHVQRVLLPPTELSQFTGDVQNYRLFLKAFDSRIASRTQDKSELLYYLV